MTKIAKFDLRIIRDTEKEYDLVIDAGVMEHVFDVRSAMRNMTDLVKTNGFIINI
jgi:2-polyprenyl-3-methyl-5-hydroxy-6-metoxy-1,4-benzoquinol methylase